MISCTEQLCTRDKTKRGLNHTKTLRRLGLTTPLTSSSLEHGQETGLVSAVVCPSVSSDDPAPAWCQLEGKQELGGC